LISAHATASDGGDVSSILQEVIDEINYEQHVVEVDESIEVHAENAKEALDEGD